MTALNAKETFKQQIEEQKSKNKWIYALKNKNIKQSENKNRGNDCKKNTWMNYMDEQPNTMNTGEILISESTWKHQNWRATGRRNSLANSSPDCFAFGKRRSTITEHIANVFKEGELDEKGYVGISD